jgi:hypothetical protein
VTVTVTRDSTGDGGIVMEAEAAEAAEVAAASALSSLPICNAAFLKLVNEFGAPSAPQLMAKTIPAPQWLAAVFAA